MMASPPSSRRGILSKLLLATGVAIVSLKNILSRHDNDQQYLEYDKPTTHSHRRALQVINDSTTHGVTIYSPRGAYISSKSFNSDKSSTPGYVIEEEKLDESKHNEPTVVSNGVVIDVISIGSQTRPEYLTGQIETWASHTDVRNYWGVTESQDYNTKCDQMTNEELQSFVDKCHEPMRWKVAEGFRRRQYGQYGDVINHAGWFCAQRRPGHALGWLQAMYGNGTMSIPDILIFVDDDTSVDIEKVKEQMRSHDTSHTPHIGAGCTFHYASAGFKFAYGGFGTFFNKASVERMTRPIHCNDDDEGQEGGGEEENNKEYMKSICKTLQENRVGERAVYQPGDSVFDVFYKYSALDNFCMHSDWAMGYMISYYSGGELQQLDPKRCRKHPCNGRSITCHNHGPMDMEKFVLAHS